MDLNTVRRITLKAADLDAEPVTQVILTQEEYELLKKKLEQVRKNQRDVKTPDYSKYPKDKLVQTLNEREKEHRKIETFYRTQVDELEAEICDARELIISLIDERNEVDKELSKARKDRQEYKTQLQHKEIEMNRKALEKEEKEHNLELAQRQILRISQQLEEEQQKIELLNTQISSLQDSLQKEKEAYGLLNKELEESQKDLEQANKTIADLEKDSDSLKKKQEFADGLTDKSLKDAIMKLSMIILSKDKSYTLTPEQRYLIKQVFGEDCSKVIEMTEKKIEELNDKNKKLRENFTSIAGLADIWLNEYLALSDWVEFQDSLISEGELNQAIQNFAFKLEEIAVRRKDAEEAKNDPKTALSVSARISIKDKGDSMSSLNPLYGSINLGDDYEKLYRKFKDQKQELEELRSKLHEEYLLSSQMRDQINELISNNNNLAKTPPKIELMRFLQCQASIVEDLIEEQVGDDS